MECLLLMFFFFSGCLRFAIVCCNCSQSQDEGPTPTVLHILKIVRELVLLLQVDHFAHFSLLMLEIETKELGMLNITYIHVHTCMHACMHIYKHK